MSRPRTEPQAPSQARLDLTPEPLAALKLTVRRVVSVGDEVLDPILVSLLAGGHVLIEGVPGTGKTLLSRTLARCLDLGFRRIQFTSDLMPSDVVGSTVWRVSEERFEFVPGPLFSNIVLADEINRTSARTLSCMLEAMEERSVTVDGTTHALSSPFLILATRNGIEFHGTFPIPEAALDRFLARVELGYPDAEAERALYRGDSTELMLSQVEPVLGADELLALMEQLPRVQLSDAVARYAHRVVEATRSHPEVSYGISPRAAISWIQAARGMAMIQGRGHVLPDDLKTIGRAVLGHRVFLASGGDARDLVTELLRSTPVEL